MAVGDLVALACGLRNYVKTSLLAYVAVVCANSKQVDL